MIGEVNEDDRSAGIGGQPTSHLEEIGDHHVIDDWERPGLPHLAGDHNRNEEFPTRRPDLPGRSLGCRTRRMHATDQDRHDYRTMYGRVPWTAHGCLPDEWPWRTCR